MAKAKNENIEEKAEEKADVKKMVKEKKTESKLKRYSEKELEKRILELANSGLTAEKVGLELRKETGNRYKKQIVKVLKEKNLFNDPDISNINQNIEILKKHMDSNKMDFTAKKALESKIAKLRKLKKYCNQ